ncbi:hypothetical protein JXA56_01520 [Candidatus Micrarchaeota archaeon]|nr:hypothetical protein [Candidatus Micrarchaeota archaeon]
MEDAQKTWEKLKADAKNDPVKMKTAVLKFMQQHARDPYAVSVIPEILKAAAALPLTPDEKQSLVASAAEFQSALLPRFELPAKDKRPEADLRLNPYEKRDIGIYAPLVPSYDINNLIMVRDTPLYVKKVKNDAK